MTCPTLPYGTYLYALRGAGQQAGAEDRPPSGIDHPRQPLSTSLSPTNEYRGQAARPLCRLLLCHSLLRSRSPPTGPRCPCPSQPLCLVVSPTANVTFRGLIVSVTLPLRGYPRPHTQ